jgi:hypothetical protein
VRVWKNAGTALLDGQAFGRLYVSPVELRSFEADGGLTNQQNVRMERNAGFARDPRASPASPRNGYAAERQARYSRLMAARLLLIGITLFGLAERLHIASFVNGQVPNSAERLVGDERGYNQMAFGLLHGEGFNWPNRVPFYPAFLAVEHWAVHGYDPIPYIGAVVGTLVVPGTYLLGWRLAGTAAGLIAAAASRSARRWSTRARRS